MSLQTLFRPTGMCLLLLSLTAGLSGLEPVPARNPADLAPPPRTYPLSAFAAIGSSFAQSSHLPELGWDEAEIRAFLDGVGAALHGKGYAFDNTAQEVSAEMGRRLQKKSAAEKPPAGEAFAQPERLAQYMKEMRKRFHLQVTDSGLGYAIQPGRPGIRPRPGDTVVVSAIVTAADGTTKLPQLCNDHVRVQLADLVPGVMEGLQMMTIDSQAIFVLPPALTFGDHEWPEGVERGTPLVFFFTLHEVTGTGAAP